MCPPGFVVVYRSTRSRHGAMRQLTVTAAGALQHLDHARKIRRAPPLPTSALICCSVTAAAGARQPEFVREAEHDVEVLVIEARIDAVLEIALDHALAEQLEHAARREPPSIASRTRAGSTPQRAARFIASATPCSVTVRLN